MPIIKTLLLPLFIKKKKKLIWILVKESKGNCNLRHLINYIRIFFQYKSETIRHRATVYAICLFYVRGGTPVRVKRSIDFGFKRHPLKPQTANEVRSLKIPCPRFPARRARVRAAKLTTRYLFRDPAWRVSDDFGKS